MDDSGRQLIPARRIGPGRAALGRLAGGVSAPVVAALPGRAAGPAPVGRGHRFRVAGATPAANSDTSSGCRAGSREVLVPCSEVGAADRFGP